MQASPDKKRKNFSLSILRRPFNKSIQERPVCLGSSADSTIKNDEKGRSQGTVSNRNRTQRIFRSIKQKLEQNKFLPFRSKDADRVELGRHRISDLMTELSCDSSRDLHSIGREHFNLAKYGWYWGPLSKKEAEEKLRNLSNGSFLVRDSSSDSHFYTLSFRSSDCTLHTRIIHSCGEYYLDDSRGRRYPSIADLITACQLAPLWQAIEYGIDSPYGCVVQYEAPLLQLSSPLSRFTEVRSLQYLCRFVIRQYISVGDIERLPVPASIQGYLVEGHY